FTAASTSSRPAIGTVASTSEVAGLNTSNISEEPPRRHSPPTQFKAAFSTCAIAMMSPLPSCYLSICLRLLALPTAVHVDRLAGEVAGFLGREEGDHRADLANVTGAAKRNLSQD